MRIFFAVITSLAIVFSPHLSSQVQTSALNTSTVHNVVNQTSATREHDVVEAQAQEQKLPDDIADSISDTDTVVSSEYVAKDDGRLVYAETGEEVTDPQIVGTEDTVPDPLARTNGESFIPVSVEAAREIIDDSDVPGTNNVPQQEELSPQASPQSSPDAENSHNAYQDEPTQSETHASAYTVGTPSVRSVGNWASSYNAKWGSYNGQQAFFEGNGSLFTAPASKVIDVSEWQGDINWDAVKSDGVQGAIIRIGYGTDATDKKALRNIREVQRVGLPFGVYLYSYASNWSEAWAEGTNVVSILKKAGITSSQQMAMPIFYDLENWTYAGHTHPTDPAVYDTIVNNFFMNVQLSGYGKVNVYSYTSYLNSALNTKNIHSRTNWVASYGSSPRYSISSYEKGWQYTSSGSINGITGSVDLNAYRFSSESAPAPVPQIQMNAYPAVTIPDGEYYINSRVKDSSSVDIVNGSTASGAAINLYQYNHSAAQKFKFTRNSNGTYTITNSASGKVLDVYGGTAHNKQTVWQYVQNGSLAQQWYIRDMGNGYAIQTALGNFVLDVANSSSKNGTQITLYEPATTEAQRFVMSSTTPLKNTNKVNILSSANGNKALDIVNGSTSNAAPIQIYTYNKSAAQTFTFKQVGNGVYEIVNTKSGRVIDVVNGSTANGARVWQYDNNHSQAQHWAVSWNADDQIMLASMASGKILDVPNGAVVDTKQLQIYTANYSVAQKWYLKDASSNSTSTTGITDGDYYISPAVSPNLALDVYGGGQANLTNVWLYTFNGSIAQQWTVKHDAQGSVSITNKGSKKALDIRNGSTQSGTNVDIYTNNDTAAQKWKLKSVGNNNFVISSVANSRNVLDVQNGAFRSESNVWVYTANNSSAQTWQFKKVQ
ncbi:RICIN domain-containing protein [Alloscardovia omnicolens]|uniref:RICIN domain-containing protein n=1 Tax=Alloscardovia omnicolens TaxID=419015 RepID=UPI003A604874